MEWKKLEKLTYEAENEKYDFHLRKEGIIWCLDIFKRKIKNNSKAYIETLSSDNLDEAKRMADKYDSENKNKKVNEMKKKVAEIMWIFGHPFPVSTISKARRRKIINFIKSCKDLG